MCSGVALSDQIDQGKKQDRFVRTLMAFGPGADDPDVEAIEGFNRFANVLPTQKWIDTPIPQVDTSNLHLDAVVIWQYVGYL